MSENTKIEWADHTFNPWTGCTKVSPGCDHCYAESMMDHRLRRVQWGPGKPRLRTSVANWRKPLAWNAAHAQFYAHHGHRQRVFCASLADVFDNEVDPAWREDLFRLIDATPNLDWLLLTKRIGNVGNMLPVPFDFERMYPNVWLGATITSQAEADRDIPKLLELDARVKFLSMEPLLGPVDFAKVPGFNRIGLHLGNWWVIVGGESGAGARTMHPDWARGIRDQCRNAGVPFLFKQWGEWAPNWLNDDDGQKIVGTEQMERMGKRIAGRLLDGLEYNGFPEVK